MAEQDITDLRHSSKVSSVQRGVWYDWVVISERADGPQPNPVDVWADHTGAFEIANKSHEGGETYTRVNEVQE